MADKANGDVCDISGGTRVCGDNVQTAIPVTVKLRLPNGQSVSVNADSIAWSLSQVIEKLSIEQNIRIEPISLLAQFDGKLLKSSPEQTLFNLKELTMIYVYGTLCICLLMLDANGSTDGVLFPEPTIETLLEMRSSISFSGTEISTDPSSVFPAGQEIAASPTISIPPSGQDSCPTISIIPSELENRTTSVSPSGLEAALPSGLETQGSALGSALNTRASLSPIPKALNPRKSISPSGLETAPNPRRSISPLGLETTSNQRKSFIAPGLELLSTNQSAASRASRRGSVIQSMGKMFMGSPDSSSKNSPRELHVPSINSDHEHIDSKKTRRASKIASMVQSIFKRNSVIDNDTNMPIIPSKKSLSQRSGLSVDDSFSSGLKEIGEEEYDDSSVNDLLDVVNVNVDNYFVEGWQLQRSNLIPALPTLNLEDELTENEENYILLKLYLIDDSVVFLKMKHNIKMELVLKYVCSQNGYTFADHTFEHGLKPNLETVELDRMLDYYTSQDLWVRKKTKSYSTIDVKQGENIIMTFQNLAMGPKIMLATTESLLEFLNDCTRKIGNLKG